MTHMYRQIMATVAVAILVGLIAVPAGAARQQMDADDNPSVSGDLELANDECRRENETFRGKVVATGKTCLRIYTFDATAEDDAARDYGVVWLQSNLNARGGWCGIKVVSDVNLPENIRAESRAPRSVSLKRRRAYTTSLPIDASGNAAEDGSSIEQNQVLYPDEVRTRVLKKKNVFRLKWTGSHAAKLGFASGAEISWSADDSPDDVTFRLNYKLERC